MKHIKMFEKFNNILEMNSSERYEILGSFTNDDFDEFSEMTTNWFKRNGKKCYWSLCYGPDNNASYSRVKSFWDIYVKPRYRMVLVETDSDLFSVVVNTDGKIYHCCNTLDKCLVNQGKSYDIYKHIIDRIQSVIDEKLSTTPPVQKVVRPSASQNVQRAKYFPTKLELQIKEDLGIDLATLTMGGKFTPSYILRRAISIGNVDLVRELSIYISDFSDRNYIVMESLLCQGQGVNANEPGKFSEEIINIIFSRLKSLGDPIFKDEELRENIIYNTISSNMYLVADGTDDEKVRRSVILIEKLKEYGGKINIRSLEKKLEKKLKNKTDNIGSDYLQTIIKELSKIK